MTDKTYNGWTNYETWNVKLWMDNDQGSQEYWQEQAQAAWDATDDDEDEKERAEEAVSSLRETLKDEFEQAECDLLETAGASASMWADLLGAAMSEVNWHEIAESLMEEVEKEVSR